MIPYGTPKPIKPRRINKTTHVARPVQTEKRPEYEIDGLTIEEWGFSDIQEYRDYMDELEEHLDDSSGFELDIGGQS